MNWRGGEHERFPVRPLTTPAKDLPAYLRHGVHAYSRMEDLSLTATRMSSFGIPLLPTNPRERRLQSSHSDTKAIQMMKSNKDTILLKRIGSLESARTLKLPPPLSSTVRPPSGAILPPIIPSSDQLVCETSTVTNNSDCKTRIEEEIDEQIEEEDSSNEVDSSDENLIDDDNSEIDELPPSGIGFRDESYSSLTSLIDVDFPQVSSGHLPYPATLLQEHLLLEHQAHTAGLQSGLNPRVNNIVRAFEIKGPLDKDLLQCALNNVVNIHPILSSKFILRINNKFYVQTSQEPVTAQLDLTTSYEKPSELVTLARRKVFHIPIKQQQQQQQQHDLQSSNATSPMTCTGDSFDDSLSIVSYKSEISPKLKPRIVSFQESSHLPSLNCLNEPPSGEDYNPLVRVKLVTKSPQDFILIISFPNIVCDYWSSCLFIQQLTNAYSKLEKSSSYRPSLTALTQIRKRQETFNALEMRRAKTSYGKTRPTTKLLQRRAQINQGGSDKGFTPICPPRCYFQQVGLRESQILLSYPKEKLWMFWETMVTATIKRLRGPPRVKVIPPIRIPSGLGEITRTSRVGRPTTSRLRPLTARNRPVTASRRVGGLTDGFSQESLSGPKRDSLSIKVEENIGLTIVQSFPEEYLAKIDRKELLGLTCLSVYVLLLGRCCRGWSVGGTTTEQDHLTQPVVSDPLQKYQQGDERRSPHVTRSPVKRRGCKLDVGSFLIGVEISLRQQAPELTQGLFGPLTNTVGVRVDLSSYQSFADLVLSLWRSVHSGRCHSHYPFSTIADELGLVQGLPVHFSYLYPHDVQQLSNPDEFYFIETSVGVEKKALARFGTCCYIDPLNTKMDDSCQLELFMWEGVRGESIDGLLLYQPHLLKHDIVKAFSKEMIQLLQIVSTNPTISLVTLASKIHPPFLHSRSRERRK